MKRYKQLIESKKEITYELEQNLTKPNHGYRAMSEAEYKNTIKKGKGILSDLRGTVEGEGTNFSDRFGIAFTYANSQRKESIISYIVEVKVDKKIFKWQDRISQYWVYEEIPKSLITNIWKITLKDDIFYMEKA